MNFEQELAGIRECRGVIATAIADRDGISVISLAATATRWKRW